MARSKSVMLGCKYEDCTLQEGVAYHCSYKVDGIRGRVEGGLVMSRKDKPVPSIYIHELASQLGIPEGFEFEMISGNPFEEPFKRTVSAVMTQGDDPRYISFYFFDRISDKPFGERIKEVTKWVEETVDEDSMFILKLLPSKICHSTEEIDEFYAKALEEGAEGIVIKRMDANYKFGRSTPSKQEMIKRKGIQDDTGIIVDIFPQQSDDDSRRGIAGSILVKGPCGLFNIGTGFTFEEGSYLLEQRDRLIGCKVDYSFMGYGTDKKPRHPRYRGIRGDL